MRNRSFFSPSFLFVLGFIIPFSLVFISYSKQVSYLSPETIEIILLGIVGYYCGIVIVSMNINFAISNLKVINSRFYSTRVLITSESMLFRVFVVIWFLGFILLWYEFFVLGALPLLSNQVEILRFNIQVNGYVHLLAISSGFISFLFFVSYMIGNDPYYKNIYLALIFITLVSLLMTGNRIDFLYPVFLMILFYAVNEGVIFNKKILVILGVMGFVFILVNAIRSSGFNDNYNYNNMQNIGEDFPVNTFTLSLYPFYMTLTYSFQVFSDLVDSNVEFKAESLFTFSALTSLLPGHQESFGEYKNWILGIDFHSEFTSTFLSVFYIDFGKMGVFIATFFYSVIVESIWWLSKFRRRYVVLYAVFAGPLLFTFYQYYYIYFYALFQVLLVLLYIYFLKDTRRH